MYRICSLVRGDGQQHAGWCTASEEYIAETTGFSLRTVQRAVAQFKADGVFAVRTYRKGGKEFNHYRPNNALFSARKRNPEEPVLVSETLPDDAETGSEESTRQNGAWPHDTVSPDTRQVGGEVCITSEVEEDGVNALQAICIPELRSAGKGHDVAISSNALSGKNHGGCAPKPPLLPVQSRTPVSTLPSESESSDAPVSPLESAAATARSKEEMLAALAKREPVPPPPSKETLAPPPPVPPPLAPRPRSKLPRHASRRRSGRIGILTSARIPWPSSSPAIWRNAPRKERRHTPSTSGKSCTPPISSTPCTAAGSSRTWKTRLTWLRPRSFGSSAARRAV
jgi:hypothetical protein